MGLIENQTNVFFLQHHSEYKYEILLVANAPTDTLKKPFYIERKCRDGRFIDGGETLLPSVNDITYMYAAFDLVTEEKNFNDNPSIPHCPWLDSGTD